MTTEIPMRLVGDIKWSTAKNTLTPGFPFNVESEELTLLMKNYEIHEHKKGTVPNRSGSAPPSVEGSFKDTGNLMALQNTSFNSYTTSSQSSLLENSKFEDQLRANPTYFEYYCANVNLNPRLPPPLLSPENKRLAHHIGGFKNNYKATSFDNRINSPSRLSQGSLSPHKEEPEDDNSPIKVSDGTILPGENSNSLEGRYKASVDLIQEPIIDRDPQIIALNDHSRDGSKSLESNRDSLQVAADPSHSNDVNLVSFQSLSLTDLIKTPHQQNESNNTHSGLDDTLLNNTSSKSSTLITGNYGINRPQQLFTQQGTFYNMQGVHPQVTSQRLNNSYVTEAASLTPGNPFYNINIPSSGFYAPQYNMGGYGLGSTLISPYIPGYPSQSAVSIPFDVSSPQSREVIQYSGDYQHFNKTYRPMGFMYQPSFVDPLHMQYLQNPLEVAYSPSVHYDDRFTSRGVRHSQTFLPPSIENITVPSPRKGASGNSYYGNSLGMGVVTQFMNSPFSGQVLSGTPSGASSLPVQRNETRFPQGSIGNTEGYSGWQRKARDFHDPKKYSFLEELKASSAHKFELSDIAGRIVEFSADQHGSRFIQQKLEYCCAEDKAFVLREVIPEASKLMTDVFGNYVIQKLFEYGSPQQRKELANTLSGLMLNLSVQMYGCRVIQKALELIELDQKTQLVHELDGHVMRCVRDQNGNHVIQKCIECIPTKNIGFVISAFQGQVAALSKHPYGCRVIQRLLEHCSDDFQGQCIVDEILKSAYVLAQDQYGNYVTQHVLDRGKPHERSQIISKLSGKIVEMSQHKFASNVVEKCLEHGNISEREILFQEILGQSEEPDNLLTMVKDQFANYVIQKIIDIGSEEQRELLFNRIRVHLHALKKYTYGKHIVSQFEQLYGEGNQDSGP